MCIDARTHRTALTKGEFYEKESFSYNIDFSNCNSRAVCSSYCNNSSRCDCNLEGDYW